jgi:hypothetical protein
VIRRRSVLNALVAAAVGSQALPWRAIADAAANNKPLIPWRNWSGSQQSLPAVRSAPASVQELQALIAAASGTVRPVGAGHSFSPLVPTDDTIVSLSRLSGLISHDPQRLQATLWADIRQTTTGP